ncbi:MAG: xanthine phosphoribosyltransferase [Desulfurococcales archaeon ex4484_42]|nr:MAG: xanthine phosphoribosyltransferase [Desulfurococcales archaeon ex4484_42]
MNVIYIPWVKAIRMCYRLAEIVMDSGESFDAIVTISRGGLIPARIVSDVLGIEEFYTIRAKFWGTGGKLYEEPLINIHEVLKVKNKKVLVVDEVVDTGATMTKVVRLLNDLGATEVKTAVLHYKVTSSHVPNFYVEKVEKWAWILYPWTIAEALYSLAKQGDGISKEDVIRNALELARRLGIDKESELISTDYLIKSLKLYMRRDGIE